MVEKVKTISLSSPLKQSFLSDLHFGDIFVATETGIFRGPYMKQDIPTTEYFRSLWQSPVDGYCLCTDLSGNLRLFDGSLKVEFLGRLRIDWIDD